MLLKPFSTSWNISYFDYLKQSYFIKLPDLGMKKVNLKGINKINELNIKDSQDLNKGDLIERNFENMIFSKTLINSETEHAKKILEQRTIDATENEEIKIQKYTMNDFAAVFSIELFDMLWINDVIHGELTDDMDIVRDSMTFSEHVKELEIFEKSAELYSQYLQNPAKKNILDESFKGFKKVIDKYKENPFAYFYLGLIYHRPTEYYDLAKAKESFLQAKKYAQEHEGQIFVAYIDFILAWMSYVEGNLDEAIKLSLESLSKDAIILSEVYFNLAKYYACKKDASNSIKYLDIAVSNSDNFYTLKANIDDDFKLIESELEKYFIHLRDKARKIVDAALIEYGISLNVTNDKDGSADNPKDQSVDPETKQVDNSSNKQDQNIIQTDKDK